MKVLDLVQGSDEWLEARLNHFTASEAPAMMNESKFMSRNELLKLKKTGNVKPVSDHLQEIFNKGHQSEAQARPIVEMKYLIALPSAVGTREIQGKSLLASFDGLSDDLKALWEHKLWNETLAENVRNSVLEPTYYWQLEHQMLVCGNKEAIFTVSDGTTTKMVSMVYHSVPDRRLELIAGWCQFDADLANYKVEAKVETIAPVKAEDFPLIKYQVKETQIYSNITELLSFVQTKAQIELSRELETDQDFADKDLLNKATKTARADLKNVVKSIQNEFVSYSEFATVAADIDKVLQKMQSHGEKQVKEAKQAKKNKIILSSLARIADKIDSVNSEIDPIQLKALMDVDPDIEITMKNKRTIESLQNAADVVVAKFKIEADQIANKVKENLLTMRELASEHKFLFSDTNQLVAKDNEDLVAVIKTRISDHEKAEEARLEKERETMRLEEEAKAQKKIQDEQKAKALAEQEAEDQRIKQEQAEEAGRITKGTVEKREKETINASDIGNLNNVLGCGHDPDNPQPEQDIPFIDGDESAPYDVPCETHQSKVFSDWWRKEGQDIIDLFPEDIAERAFGAGVEWATSR